jgi:hypothetical protein
MGGRAEQSAKGTASGYQCGKRGWKLIFAGISGCIQRTAQDFHASAHAAGPFDIGPTRSYLFEKQLFRRLDTGAFGSHGWKTGTLESRIQATRK